MKIGHIIDALSYGGLGVGFLLMALGKMRVSSDPDANRQWIEKWGVLVGIVGAVLLGMGIYHAVMLF